MAGERVLALLVVVVATVVGAADVSNSLSSISSDLNSDKPEHGRERERPRPPAGRMLMASGGYDGYTTDTLATLGFTHELLGSSFVLASYRFLAPTPNASFPGDPYTPGSPAEAWRQNALRSFKADLDAMHSSNITALSSMDIFVVPMTIFKAYERNMTGPGLVGGTSSTRIALNNFTLWLLDQVLDEVFDMFPTLDGIMVRVGENYGGPSDHGAPDWMGNGAVDFSVPFSEQQAQYAAFINQLRASICVKHGKTLVFRTWDTSGFSPKDPARFHPSLPYYLNVTNQVQPHPNLIFSIKHVALDYWRWVQWNPTLGQGKHQQLIEVECQREYEGKGAMPMYVGDGVVHGFSEFADRAVGLVRANKAYGPQLVGLWLWASGGGWHGPHVGNQTMWPEMNFLVLASWWLHAFPNGTSSTEAAEFSRYCAARHPTLSTDDCDTLHHIALLSQDAILATRYCSAYDSSLQTYTATHRAHASHQASSTTASNGCGTVSCMPVNNWLRDDRLDGLQSLGRSDGSYGNPGAILYLFQHNKTHEAIEEKKHAVDIWSTMVNLSKSVHTGELAFRKELVTTTLYGQLLSKVILYGWEVMTLGLHGQQTGTYDVAGLRLAISQYDAARHVYNATLAAMPLAATPFLDAYEGGTNEASWRPGLGASVDAFRNVSNYAV